MVSDLANKYLDHPKRDWITWTAAGIVVLALALPAWDSLAAARGESASLNSELHDTHLSVSNLSLMQQKLREISAKPAVFDELINLQRADQIRESVARLVHQMDCQMRRLTLSDPITRVWSESDDPFASTPPENAEESGFQLEARRLNVVVDGSLAQLCKLTIALTQIDRFAVPTDMTVRRETVNGHLRLDINISLFNLVEVNDG